MTNKEKVYACLDAFSRGIPITAKRISNATRRYGNPVDTKIVNNIMSELVKRGEWVVIANASKNGANFYGRVEQ